MWLCMWKLTISEEILIWFLDYFNIFALCEQFWKIRILGPLLRQKALLPRWSPFGDFGPHGDQIKFFGPHFFQSPHFLHLRLKNASKVSVATI